MRFRDYIPAFLSPAWLLSPKGKAALVSFGSVLDDLMVRAKDGTKARFASIGPRDALGTLATERGLPQGIGESDAGWAARLVGAWSIWYWAGTPYGVLRALYTAGYAPKLFTAHGLEYELDLATGLVMTVNNAGVGYDFGLGASNWSSFILYFPASRWTAAWVAAGNPPSQSSDEAQVLMLLVRRWAAAFASFTASAFSGTAPVCGLAPVPICGAGGLICGGTYWSWNRTPPSPTLP